MNCSTLTHRFSKTPRTDWHASQQALDNYTGTDEGGKSQLELRRDEARHRYENEDETYQLLKDIAENLEIGYDVGETLITKLKQTHDVKERVYPSGRHLLHHQRTRLHDSWARSTPASTVCTKSRRRPRR